MSASTLLPTFAFAALGAVTVLLVTLIGIPEPEPTDPATISPGIAVSQSARVDGQSVTVPQVSLSVDRQGRLAPIPAAHPPITVTPTQKAAVSIPALALTTPRTASRAAQSTAPTPTTGATPPTTPRRTDQQSSGDVTQPRATTPPFAPTPTSLSAPAPMPPREKTDPPRITAGSPSLVIEMVAARSSTSVDTPRQRLFRLFGRHQTFKHPERRLTFKHPERHLTFKHPAHLKALGRLRILDQVDGGWRPPPAGVDHRG